MTFAARKPQENIMNKSLKSTWTPLNDPSQNIALYEERRDLVSKWFAKWADAQRCTVLLDLLELCTLRQKQFLERHVKVRVPVEHLDFTTVLPRVVSLHIFGYLDPRTLSRCAQVCWRWNWMTSLDVLWMPKCLRLGWFLQYRPSTFEEGAWKRLYIETIISLREAGKLKVLDSIQPPRAQSAASSRRGSRPNSAASAHLSSRFLRSVKVTSDAPAKHVKPWRGSDPHPVDTLRYNYLDNGAEAERRRRRHRKKSSEHATKDDLHLIKEEREGRQTDPSAEKGMDDTVWQILDQGYSDEDD